MSQENIYSKKINFVLNFRHTRSCSKMFTSIHLGTFIGAGNKVYYTYLNARLDYTAYLTTKHLFRIVIVWCGYFLLRQNAIKDTHKIKSNEISIDFIKLNEFIFDRITRNFMKWMIVCLFARLSEINTGKYILYRG